MLRNKKTHYDTFKEWQADLARMNKNPNDVHLMQSIVNKVEKSSDKVKGEVKEYLVSSALETNPWMVFLQVIQEYPGNRLMVKTRDDPWFYV